MSTFCPDQTMLRHYIQDKLSPTEDEQVELWLMDNPDVVDDLKLDLALAKGVHPQPNSISKTDLSFWAWLIKPQFALATMLTLAIGAGIGFIVGNENFQTGSYSPSTIVERLPLEITRGVNADTPDARIYLDNRSSIIILELNTQPWTEQHNAYRVNITLSDESFTLDAEPSQNNIIEVAFASSSIESDSIQLELIGKPSNGEPVPLKTYYIEVIRS